MSGSNIDAGNTKNEILMKFHENIRIKECFDTYFYPVIHLIFSTNKETYNKISFDKCEYWLYSSIKLNISACLDTISSTQCISINLISLFNPLKSS